MGIFRNNQRSRCVIKFLKANNPFEGKKFPKLSAVFILLILISNLITSCHLPQSDSPNPIRSDQQKTAVAGILNPPGLQTPKASPAPTTYHPTQAVPTTESANTPLEVFDGELSYTVQQGDTLPALIARFGVSPGSLRSNEVLSVEARR